jgi:hypothetical protein
MVIRNFTVNSHLPFDVANSQHRTKQCSKCCTYARIYYIKNFADIKSFLFRKASFAKVFLDLILRKYLALLLSSYLNYKNVLKM